MWSVGETPVPYIVRGTHGYGGVTWVAQDLSDPALVAVNPTASFGWPRIWEKVLGKAKPEPRDVLVDMPPGPYNDGRKALIHGDRKLIVANEARFDLYDLAADPAESRNLARSDAEGLQAMKDRYAALKARMRLIEVTGKKK